MTSRPDETETPAPEEIGVEAAGAAENGLEAVEVGPAEDAPVVPDERLLAAHDLALSALKEITPASTIGEPAGYTVEADGVVSLLFSTTLEGYPGWFWTVSLAVVEGAEPTVLEAELLPGEGALLAPEWVPWAVRLAEYQAQQAQATAEAAAGAAEDEDDDEGADEDDADLDDELDDVDDLDADDFDRDGSPILHAGDVDGVDIDELDDAVDEADDIDESDDIDEDDDLDGDETDDDGR